jgi:transcriptional regulator with XRE-family HTH domain
MTNGIKATTEVDAFIGEKIRGYRNLRKLSQDELGKMLGVTFQQVQKYEKGVNRITSSRLDQIAQIFGCELTDLLPTRARGKKAKGLTNVDRVIATRDGMKLIDSFVTIKNEAVRSAIVELARRCEGI